MTGHRMSRCASAYEIWVVESAFALFCVSTFLALGAREDVSQGQTILAFGSQYVLGGILLLGLWAITYRSRQHPVLRWVVANAVFVIGYFLFNLLDYYLLSGILSPVWIPGEEEAFYYALALGVRVKEGTLGVPLLTVNAFFLFAGGLARSPTGWVVRAVSVGIIIYAAVVLWAQIR